MAVLLAPVAGVLLRYTAVALAGYAMARAIAPGRRDQRAEDALDDLPEGVTMRREAGQSNATARYTRTIRIGRTGPGVKVDCSALGRIRVRKAG